MLARGGLEKWEVAEIKGRDMAGTTGLEPATSGVTGRRSNQLSYVPAFADLFNVACRHLWSETTPHPPRLHKPYPDRSATAQGATPA